MRKRQLRALALLVLFGTVAATACATSEDQAPVEVPPVVILEPGPAEMPDASDASDASDAGVEMPADPCSTSGLCIVQAPIDTQINVTSIWGSGPSDVWAVGTNRTILHYDGKAWEKAAPLTDAVTPFTMRSVWLNGPNDVWIAAGPRIYHSTGWNGPSGTEWTSTSFLDGAGITAIRGLNGRVLIARQVQNDFSSKPPAIIAGSGWSGDGVADSELVDTPMFTASGADGLWSLAMVRPDEAWATRIGTGASLGGRAGARVVRIHRAIPDGGEPDAGASWQVEEHESQTARNLYGVWGDEVAVWVVGEGGVVRRMTLANVSSRAFEVVPSPVIADLRGVHGFGPNDVWAVGDDATVLHFDGKAWTRVSTPFDTVSAKPRFFAVWGSSSKDVWIGGNGVMLHFEGQKTP